MRKLKGCGISRTTIPSACGRRLDGYKKRRLKYEERLEYGVPELQIPGKSHRKTRRNDEL